MSFDVDWKPSYFVEEKRIEADGNIGVFKRADKVDANEEEMRYDLKEFNDVFNAFAEKQGLISSQSNLYYHNRLKGDPTVLRMGFTIMADKRDITDTDAYFIGKIASFGNYPEPGYYIAKLKDRLLTTSKDLSVWGYSGGEFQRMKDVESNSFNSDIYRSINALYRWPGTEKVDPFWEVAVSIHPSLKQRASR